MLTLNCCFINAAIYPAAWRLSPIAAVTTVKLCGRACAGVKAKSGTEDAIGCQPAF